MKEIFASAIGKVAVTVFAVLPVNFFIVWLLSRFGTFEMAGFGDISLRQMYVIAVLGTIMVRV